MKLPFVVAAALTLFVGQANAITMLGSPTVCHAVARDVQYISAEVRDSGVPWKEFEPVFTASLKEAKGGPGVYVQDDDDVTLLVETYRAMWTSKSTPDQLYATVFNACVGSQKKFI